MEDIRVRVDSSTFKQADIALFLWELDFDGLDEFRLLSISQRIVVEKSRQMINNSGCGLELRLDFQTLLINRLADVESS